MVAFDEDDLGHRNEFRNFIRFKRWRNWRERTLGTECRVQVRVPRSCGKPHALVAGATPIDPRGFFAYQPKAWPKS